MAHTRITTDGITDGSILNADINSSAAIALSKLNTSGTAGSGNFLRGDGAWTAIDLTALSASNLTSGTVPDARFPSTLPAASGANLTALNGSNISSGTVAAARVATLNQNTTGSAATLTTARTIGGTSFDGSANIAVALAATTTALATARTIGGTSFDGTANIDISYANLTNKLSVGDGGLTQNNFTNTLKSKLDGIASSATNVTNNNQLTNGAGYITATLTEEQVEDYVGGMVTGNTETGITVTYQDGDGTLDFAVASQTDNNFTTTLKNKLDGIASGATNVTNNNQLTNGAGYVTTSGAFASGTKMVFNQTSAPTGWTKVTSNVDNRALRVVSGSASSGGSVAFTTAFASQSVAGSVANTTAGGSIANTTAGGSISINNTTAGGSISTNNTTAGGSVSSHTLSTSQMPSHTHYATINGAYNDLFYPNQDTFSRGEPKHGNGTTTKSTGSTGGGGSHNHSFSGSAHSHSGSFSGSAHNHSGSFSGSAHNHSFTGSAHNHSFSGTSINLAVQYIDVIIASKD